MKQQDSYGDVEHNNTTDEQSNEALNEKRDDVDSDLKHVMMDNYDQQYLMY